MAATRSASLSCEEAFSPRAFAQILQNLRFKCRELRDSDGCNRTCCREYLKTAEGVLHEDPGCD